MVHIRQVCALALLDLLYCLGVQDALWKRHKAKKTLASNLMAEYVSVKGWSKEVPTQNLPALGSSSTIILVNYTLYLWLSPVCRDKS